MSVSAKRIEGGVDDAPGIHVRSSQKFFSEEEVCRLSGLCLEHLRQAAESRRLGCQAETSGILSGKIGEIRQGGLFSASDLAVLVSLFSPCDH